MLSALLTVLSLPLRPFINWFIDPKLVLRKKPLDGHPIFLVVHGTWARKARWIRPGEPLDVMLHGLDEHAGVAVFTWSGSNHLTARTKAAAGLRAELAELQRLYSNSGVTAIAHSHGGNVVAWAASTTDAIRRAVYVNTPFIAPIAVKDRFVAFAVTWFVVWLLLWAESGLIRIGVIDWKAIMALLIATAAASAIMGLIALGEVRAAPFAGRPKVERQLVLHAAGDEALSGLTALYAVHALVTLISRPFLVVLVLGMLICTTLLNTNWWGLAIWGEDMYYVPLQWLFRTARLYVWLVFAAVLAYGPLQGLMSLQHPLLVTPTPLGSTDALTVNVARKRGTGWFLHSIPLADEKVLGEIANWLERTRHKS